MFVSSKWIYSHGNSGNHDEKSGRLSKKLASSRPNVLTSSLLSNRFYLSWAISICQWLENFCDDVTLVCFVLNCIIHSSDNLLSVRNWSEYLVFLPTVILNRVLIFLECTIQRFWNI